MSLSDESFNELHQLLSALCDGRIRDDQTKRLEKLVCADPESRWYYVRHMHLHANLSRFVQVNLDDLTSACAGWFTTEPDCQESAVGAVAETPIESCQKVSAPKIHSVRQGWPNYRRMAFYLSAAAVILILCLVTDGLLPKNSASSQVFASVLQQLRTAHVISYTAEFQEGGKITQTAEAMHLQPDRVREERPDGSIRIIDFSKHQCITIDPTHRKAVVLEEAHGSQTYRQERFLDKIKEYIERIRTNPLRTDHYLGKRNMGGKTVEGYEMRKPTQVQTLWVDVETGLLTEMKIATPDDPGRNVVMRNFRFDVETYESLFSVVPPPGFEVIFKTVEPTKQLDDRTEMIPR
jgi:outer membrane lipoprotein-sorting protein